ncbi:hypothetical protein T459_05667 [Capsicum annuum]|uniref:Uncharacterized protein n=1 Tax=Capsicum annuum TaxID=4072 RepID=A0A2G3A8K1_CAPAN|nr:hypothetical protein T459_05667 [Capsicum annuum]
MGRDHLGGVILGLLTLGGIDFSRKRLLSKKEEETLTNDLEAKVDYVSQLLDVDKAKVDYTSQLLDDVLSSILARMTIKDVVKTSILSTRSYMSALLSEKFLEVVNQFLQLYLGHKVVELEMNTFIQRKFSSEFGQLMHSVSKLGVERLHLNFSCGKIPTSKYINLHRNTFFEFSLELLSQASSLKSLFLSVCVVQPSVTLRLNSLKTLFLTGVLLEMGQLEGLEEIDLQATKLHEFECFFNNRVRFYFSSVPVLEHVKISLRGDASMPYIFGEFAANLPAQVKSLIVTAWNTQVTHFPTEMQIFRNLRMLVFLFESTYNFDIVKVSPVLDVCPVLQSLQILCQGSGMMAEDNSNELASPVTSVKNDSMAEDNTDELVSPVTSVKNDSMDEDNIDELVSPVTSVKNESAGSKPDKISTIKPRSMSNGNKVLPYYRSSSTTSSYNAGNTRRQSTGKLNAPDSRQDVIPHYLRASTGSCHDFCKYGRKHSSEAKPWHPLSKRKNKLPADEQSPARTLVGEAKKETLVKQKLSTPPGSVLGEKKKVIGVEQKPSTSPGSMLGEAKKMTVVMQKTSTTSRSNQSDAKKGILVKQKLSTPPVNMLEEGKKVNEVYQKPSSPQESVLKDEKEVTMVEQKPSSPSGCMEGGIDEVTMVEQKSSASLVSMLGEGENVTMVE